MKSNCGDRTADDAEVPAPTEACCANPQFSTETVGCLTQRVCTSCGAVVAGSDERYENGAAMVAGGGTTFTFTSGVSVAASQRARHRAGSGQRPCRSLLRGVRLIRSLCAALQCRGEARDAEAEYERALADDSLRFVSAATKEAVAGACVYLRARGRGEPVTLASVAALLPSRDVFALGAAVKTVAAVVGSRVPPPPDVADMVASVIGNRGSQQQLQKAPPLFDEADVRRVTRVVELLRDLSLTARRRPDTVVLGAAFAYERLRRPKVRLGEFLNRLGAPSSRQQQVSLAAKDFDRALVQSCAGLPWMCGRSAVGRKEVWSNLDHVLRYRHCVLHEARRRQSSAAAADAADVSDEALAAAIEPLAARAGEIDAALSRLDDPSLGESDIPESELSAFIRSAEEASAWAAARAVVDDPTAAEAHKWAAVAGASRKRKAVEDSTANELSS